MRRFNVSTGELVIAAASGAVFGVLGYYATRHIHNALSHVPGVG